MSNTLTTYEDKLNYLVTLIESGKKIDWDYAVKRLELKMNPDSLRKAFNTTQFSGYNIYKYMLDKQHEDCDTTELQKLQELQDAIFKERVKLQDANREKRKYLRDFSRVDVLKEYLEQQLNDRQPISFRKCYNSYIGQNEAVSLVSDIHYGATVDSIFNQYNTDIAKERLELLANKIIDTCKRNDVNTLHIGLLGDFITGIIHGSTIAQAQEDLIDQIINVSNLLSYFCGYIAEQIPNVNVYVVYGNHERSTQGKSDRAYKENFGRLIAVILKKDLKNICKVIDNGYEDFVQFVLKNGKTVVMTHGTNDSVESANENFSKLLHTDVYRVYMGHLHDVKESRGTLVNGSIMGGDDYSISKRLNSKPTQLLEIYYKGTDDYSTYRFVL